jgi:hypothetical protein
MRPQHTKTKLVSWDGYRDADIVQEFVHKRVREGTNAELQALRRAATRFSM